MNCYNPYQWRCSFHNGDAHLTTHPCPFLTLPPHSMWIPCGIHVIPHGFHPFHMEYVLAEESLIWVIPFHVYSIWNGQIPLGIHHSIWNFHMEFRWNIPCGFHVIDGFQVDSMS